MGNQILALVQCQLRGLQPGPINTFPKWKDLGRFVKRGERALTLCMPITCKRREEDSDEEHTSTSFVYKARWFVLSQTDGQELEPITVPEWDADRALTALRVERIPFDHTDGNIQGFARNDAESVMKWSGHKTLESFSVYLRPRNEGRILATQAMSNVDATLTLQGSVESVRSVGSVEEQAAKLLQDKQVAL